MPARPIRVPPALFVLLLLAAPAPAQDGAPATPRELCLAHAQTVYARQDDTIDRIALDPDEPPTLARAGGARIGAQPISAVVTGTGGLRRKDGSTAAFRWLCVLDDRGRAAFFHAGPEPAPRALVACWRWSATRVELDDCLAAELLVAERALEAAERKAGGGAARLDAATGRRSAGSAQRASDRAWRAYRDAECDRVAEMAAGGSGAGDFYRACLIDRTRARIAELSE